VKKKAANVWEPENIDNFWEWFSKNKYNVYFSKLVGSGILYLVKKQRSLSGDFLDYGCGPGFLLEQFLKTGMNCYGCDTSESSVNIVNEKFTNKEHWKGAKKIESCTIPFEDNKFDIITCVETIEHLSDEILDSVLKELYRSLNPEGIIIFTTPNNENLDKNFIYCPFCGSEFHRVQHVRSFSKSSLTELLGRYNFKVIYSKETDLQYYCKLDNLHLFFCKIYYLVNKHFLERNYVEPHLIIMAKKQSIIK
jgi:2-polyprenyl-3-methyl-5-hydroxy-6-metoxy-1,4-benzoquinol methylase